MLRYLLLVLTIPLLSAVTAQNNQWTLEKSVEYAVQNNLQVRQLQNQLTGSLLQLKGDQLSRLPNLSGSSSYGAQFGRTIDPTTNSFEQQAITFNSFQLSANATIYAGSRIKNSIRQSKLSVEAAELEAKSTANDIGLNVANSYLTVLLTREQLINSRAQLQLTKDQLRQTDAAIKAGSLPEAQRYDLVAQEAANNRTIIELENQVKLALLNLQLTLELDPSSDFNIITPDLDINERDLIETFTYEEVYLSASNLQPDLRAAQLRTEAAEVGKDIAKAGFYPTLSAFGQLNTNFSSVAKEVNRDNVTIEPGDPVPALVNDIPVSVAFFEPTGIIVSDQPYFDQLNQNFGQSVGLSLNVPIYSQGRNKIAVQQAEVNRINTDIQYQQVVNQLQSEVQTAVLNWQGAVQAYKAAKISADASDRAYQVAKRRFDLGASNNLDLLTATNRLDQARTEQTRAKFQLIFNRQVIQFYLGNPLTLN